MITKTEIHKGFIGKKRGWAFSIYFNNKEYPNLISALYKTKKQIQVQLQRYIDTGKYDTYGTAE